MKHWLFGAAVWSFVVGAGSILFACSSGGGESVIRTPAGHLSQLMADPSFQRAAGDVRDNPAWQEQLASEQQGNFLRALQTMHANSQAIARAANWSAAWSR